VKEKPDVETQKTEGVISAYGSTREECAPVVDSVRKRPVARVDFMMKFERGLEEPDPKRALMSAATIGGAHVAGGFVPRAPYMFISYASSAILYSIPVMPVAPEAFGYIQDRYTGTSQLRSAMQTLIIGGIAAAAFAIARAIS
jgi:VIT1/CCC1 family predicted Fe2+/Mn2+ transporter